LLAYFRERNSLDSSSVSAVKKSPFFGVQVRYVVRKKPYAPNLKEFRLREWSQNNWNNQAPFPRAVFSSSATPEQLFPRAVFSSAATPEQLFPRAVFSSAATPEQLFPRSALPFAADFPSTFGQQPSSAAQIGGC